MARPTAVRLRMYQMGFGECMLLTFDYREDRRHVLIDFGSTRMPDGAGTMEEVARDIASECGSDPVAIVATHRHKDHISGFGAKATWKHLARLKVTRVVQPWTEQPDLAADATAPLAAGARDARGHVRALAAMQARAAEIRGLLPKLGALPAAAREEIDFIADDNLPNPEAVRNLASFGSRCRYVCFGSTDAFGQHLPGVKVHVLGPPTLEQSDDIRKQARTSEEFWQMKAMQPLPLAGAAGPAPSQGGPPLERRSDEAPLHARWLAERLERIDCSRLVSIVRALDKAMNNTSVILLFEIGEARLLFPGDAQIESWSYALSHDHVRELLKGVTLYKVGHHGSRNATPRSMWDDFERRGEKDGDRRLISCLSTLDQVHGTRADHTEVPRELLVRALRKESALHSTLRMTDLFEDIPIPI
ncbi:MAG: hypothetical protein IT372_02410 [Polyangiaceae bacterium]|nr:hypothetical protein [Polyangiaceae bacterium]